jgi:hypothetical protein
MKSLPQDSDCTYSAALRHPCQAEFFQFTCAVLAKFLTRVNRREKITSPKIRSMKSLSASVPSLVSTSTAEGSAVCVLAHAISSRAHLAGETSWDAWKGALRNVASTHARTRRRRRHLQMVRQRLKIGGCRIFFLVKYRTSHGDIKRGEKLHREWTRSGHRQRR